MLNSGLLHNPKFITTEIVKPPSIMSGLATAVPTLHSAVLATLEALGARSLGIPVVMPITTSPEVFSATLRSGAIPLVLDIDSDLNLDKYTLALVIEELGNPVVLMDNYCQLYQEDLTVVSIESKNHLADLVASGNISLLEDIVQCRKYITICNFTSASFILSQYPDLNKDIRQVASGALGQYSLKHTVDLSTDLYVDANYNAIQSEYLLLAEERNIDFRFHGGKALVHVKNADATIAGMFLDRIEARRGVVPLHNHPGLKDQWADASATYPIAEEKSKHFVQVPFDQHLNHKDMVRILDSVKANS